jgi:eukaryotic-like serine/threonine-protein kinase
MASAPELPKVGETIGGRFTLGRVLGEGGMGIVYEALDARTQRPCALKILFPEHCNVPQIVARFDREARVAAKLKGPNVARVLDVGALSNDLRYIAMELLVGRDLETELRTRGRLPVADAVDIVVQAATAMREAHALGVVHRDLKPANLFLVEDAESKRAIVKVLDFGISRLMGDESKLTTDFSPLGTAVYMSPEQIESAARVDERTDVWALGVVLYELLAGRPPFDGQNTAVLVAVATKPVTPLSTVVDDVPPELEAVVMHALEKSPDARLQSMDELARALEPWAPAASIGGARRPRGGMKVIRVIAALAALVALVALGVVAVGFVEARSTRTAGDEADLGASASASAAASSSASASAPPRHASTTPPTRRSPAPHGSPPRAGTHASAKPTEPRRP